MILLTPRDPKLIALLESVDTKGIPLCTKRGGDASSLTSSRPADGLSSGH